MNDQEFNLLCHHNSFGDVAREEFPLVPRALLKGLVDAAIAEETRNLQDHVHRLQESLTFAKGRDIQQRMELDKAGFRINKLETALRRIANQDYRGNRSTESQIAQEALA